ncbi:hypothetical protein N0V93_000712 [Gnomoniopsis smithogilvyi]|uniref:Clr5 domain-containing protein n=1 Tax=Gnomoniopsis smithogilvyi TaxID=1191159 RepID=A0A9W8Z2B0_9PEZI|nr:hypothetical protein N0V93_000712 [Gnomoniopsis smithogilvyi]
MNRPLEIRRLASREAERNDLRQSENGRPTTPDIWSRHIAQIKRLYVDENCSLAQVMNTMAKDHDFHAGKKSYKAQLKKRGINKNVRLDQKDVSQALQLVRKAEKNGLDLADQRVKLASGQVVTFKRLASHLGRKKLTVDDRWKKVNVTMAQESLAESPLSLVINGPDIFRLPELVFLDVARYVSQKFSDGPAALNPEIRGPNNPLAIQAHSTIDDAANLLADGKLEDAIVQLRVAPELMNMLLANGDVEPPMTLFLIWKTIVSLTASAKWANLDVEETVKSLVRYIASICNAQTSISPQLRRIVAALSKMSQIDGHLMFSTAEQGILCMCAQQDLVLGIPGSIYSSFQQSTRDWYATQKWMANFEHTIWPAWEQLVQIKGESAPETIAALYSILVLERQKPRNRGDASNRFFRAVEQTLQKIPDDLALALTHREAHIQWAVANMPRQNDSPELIEIYMQDARDTSKSRQQTTLFELSGLRAWFAEANPEPTKI